MLLFYQLSSDCYLWPHYLFEWDYCTFLFIFIYTWQKGIVITYMKLVFEFLCKIKWGLLCCCMLKTSFVDTEKKQNSRRIVSTTESYIYLPYSALHNFTLVVKSGCPVENVHFKLDQHAWQSTGKLVAPLGHIIQITTISLSFMS